MSLESLLIRLADRLAEQERADFLAAHRRIWTRLGLPFTAEDKADSEAYWRWSRTLPADLDFEETLRQCANWWAARRGLSAEEAEDIIADAVRAVAEHHADECPADCPICG